MLNVQGRLLVGRVLAGTTLGELATSARHGGFADALQQALAEVESGLLDPEQLDGDLGEDGAGLRPGRTGDRRG